MYPNVETIKEHISIDNKSSEWIRIKLPATTYVFKWLDNNGATISIRKKIVDVNGRIVWRHGWEHAGYDTITNPLSVIHFEDMWKYFYKHELRKEKLERICKDIEEK